MRILSTLLMSVFLMALTACAAEQAPKAETESTAKTDGPERHDFRAKLNKVEVDLEEEYGWRIVPKDVKRITIHAEAENASSVIFWLAPTGTETGTERELIGYDVDGRDGWSLTWEVGSRELHHHLSVEVLGMDGATMASQDINVHTQQDGE